METIKKYLPYITLILLFVVVGLAIAYIQSNSERKSLERANNALEEVFEQELEKERQNVDSLNNVIDKKELNLLLLQGALIAIDEKEQNINENINEELDNIRSYGSDSLELYFSRRYD